jgi:hypothetical protein
MPVAESGYEFSVSIKDGKWSSSAATGLSSKHLLHAVRWALVNTVMNLRVYIRRAIAWSAQGLRVVRKVWNLRNYYISSAF